MEIRVIYLKETLTIKTITESNDSISHYPGECSVISGSADEVIRMASALNLDLTPILDFYNTNNIFINMTPEKITVLKRKAFAQNLLNDFLAENVEMDISFEDNIILLTKLMNAKQMLEVGALETAALLINAIEPDAIFTETRRDGYVQRIQNYLNH